MQAAVSITCAIFATTCRGSARRETDVYIVTFRFEQAATGQRGIRKREVDPPSFFERKQAAVYAEDQARLSTSPVRISVEEKKTRKRLLTHVADGVGNFKSIGSLV